MVSTVSASFLSFVLPVHDETSKIAIMTYKIPILILFVKNYAEMQLNFCKVNANYRIMKAY